MENLLLDTPVIRREDDHFQRYAYAKRIASLITKADLPHSLVVGIYGKWGEGKSSLLNFIGVEIGDQAEQIGFNPWYFKDDQQLLKAFFEAVATALGKKLTTNKNAALTALGSYGDSVGAVANIKLPGAAVIGKLVSKVAASFRNDSLEHYKERLQKLIREAGGNFVVFIDDIDRLNSEDMHAVFRLVKLVGDFPRFTYVLAFDDELVAASLGSKFGAGQPKDGYDYLEKIIQVPLTLPKASAFDLRKYALTLLNKTLTQLEVNVSEEDNRRFLGKFDAAFVPGLKNPRLAVRLANAIAFSIPLLQGEVNIADLMILDGIKVFYPELYAFMRHNPAIFLTHYDAAGSSASGQKERAKKDLTDMIAIYGEALAPQIKSMLWSLFPQLNGLFNNIFPSKERIDQWYKDQQLCSRYYYDRYFSFAVKTGELSDKYFTELFADVDKMDPADFSGRLLKQFGTIDPDEFIFKLRCRVDTFSREESTNLALVLARLGPVLPEQTTFQVVLPKEEMAKIVKQLIAKAFPDQRYPLSAKALKAAQPLNYKIILYFRLVKKPDELIDGTLLADHDILPLADVMVSEFEAFNRRVNAMRDVPDYDLQSIFAIYETAGKKEAIMELANLAFQSDPQFILKLLKIFTQTIWSTAAQGPQKTAFRIEDYNFMSQFIAPAVFYDRLLKLHHKRTIFNGRPLTFGDSLTDDELIAQFQALHEEITQASKGD